MLTAGWARYADAVVEGFLHGGYLDDPNLPYIQEGTPAPRVLSFDPMRWPERSRVLLIEGCEVTDNFPAVAACQDHIVYCQFSRHGSQRPYEERERRRLGDIVPVLAKLALLHSVLPSSSRPEVVDDASVAEYEAQMLRRRLRPSPLTALTEREQQVCFRILLGYSSKEIAHQLDVATSTINSHRKHAYERLGIASQNEIFLFCLHSLAGIDFPLPERFPSEKSAAQLVRTPDDEVRALRRPLQRSPFEDLTEREQQICFRILLGYSSEAIGLHLGISTNTVLAYRRIVYAKLGVFSQNKLFLKYLQSLPAGV